MPIDTEYRDPRIAYAPPAAIPVAGLLRAVDEAATAVTELVLRSGNLPRAADDCLLSIHLAAEEIHTVAAHVEAWLVKVEKLLGI